MYCIFLNWPDYWSQDLAQFSSSVSFFLSLNDKITIYDIDKKNSRIKRYSLQWHANKTPKKAETIWKLEQRAGNCANRHNIEYTCIIHSMSFVHYLFPLLLDESRIVNFNRAECATDETKWKKGLPYLCVRSGCDAFMIHFLFKFNPSNVCFSIKRIKWNRNLHNIHKSTIQLNISTNPNNNKRKHSDASGSDLYLFD